MANLNVAAVGIPGYAKSIAKAGTSTDLIFYNLKKGGTTVTFIEPVRYPERLAPLFYAVSMADCALLVVDAITPEFGETVVMLDAAGISSGYIILRNYLDKSQVMPLLNGTVLENYEFLEDNPVEIRERLLEDAVSISRPHEDFEGSVVPVDHLFNVKGIGTVVLGCVGHGAVHVHDQMTVLPSGKTAQVRSIQKHDDDFTDAEPGDRVGLALKNITTDELDRGDVLFTGEGLKVASEITGPASLNKFWQLPLKEGMMLHVGHWMQYIPARVESVDNGDDWHRPALKLSLEKEMVFLPGDTAVIHYLDAGKLRVAGTVRIE